MQLEASIRVVEQRGHLLFRGVATVVVVLGIPRRLDVCFLDVFFGGAKNEEDGCFFFQRMGSFSEKSKKINNGFQKE